MKVSLKYGRTSKRDPTVINFACFLSPQPGARMISRGSAILNRNVIEGRLPRTYDEFVIFMCKNTLYPLFITNIAVESFMVFKLMDHKIRKPAIPAIFKTYLRLSYISYIHDIYMLYTWNRQAKAAMATRIFHRDFIWGFHMGIGERVEQIRWWWKIGDVDVLLIMENVEMGLKNGKFNGI